MRKNHVVTKGKFVVGVSYEGKLPVEVYAFRSYELAYRFFRYRCNVLGWLGTFHYLPLGGGKSIRLAHRG